MLIIHTYIFFLSVLFSTLVAGVPHIPRKQIVGASASAPISTLYISKAQPPYPFKNRTILKTIRDSLTGRLPFPICAKGAAEFQYQLAKTSIDYACKNSKAWNYSIVPPISLGNGKTADGKTKTIGLSADQGMNGTSNKFWLGIHHATHRCTGPLKFAVGNSDQEKRDHCIARFRRIIDRCRTDGNSGGYLRDGCAVYTVKALPQDETLTDSWWPKLGDFKCKPSDGADRGKCTCWFSNYPWSTDTFKMPNNGDCTNVDRTQLA
ncbi:hypothetical protein D8B26_000460 [Coccidioides posadasii str. Silveira]|uniref:Uncharacterized protein n=3 Tax=Coccidioides posadasii TaxID=199306 RepID=E9DFN3_COCPS|nr:hypothetical protein CPC735_068580 [Coccidioides posadasii C735 delta SOWgp]EER29176.1 hypothetical protein CPC735_068580 [Coccidioides posadasii C735 delta SOWgp]EFW14890.1 conserved hypothetical protein [Coccidioides posadasii str. Silveira]KMM70559.1 hypothetical protein CPAG_06870 [Coccidioides posadasii RMSCC 3488]QVM05751.1 hypothetical protein D8B26_000460 [Coccidioides posadasii str. Silveira]|eukprot:XP_003071321.1 hypothetical protein CPC735_068580 [Coccidioides posadasii C735 delta SOWgp]